MIQCFCSTSPHNSRLPSSSMQPTRNLFRKLWLHVIECNTASSRSEGESLKRETENCFHFHFSMILQFPHGWSYESGVMRVELLSQLENFLLCDELTFSYLHCGKSEMKGFSTFRQIKSSIMHHPCTVVKESNCKTATNKFLNEQF